MWTWVLIALGAGVLLAGWLVRVGNEVTGTLIRAV
jgi:hypothetical protein